ncbi:MAG: glycosyltransferase [Alphaproteobacteria bacterium]
MTPVSRSDAAGGPPSSDPSRPHLHIITDLDIGGAERMLVNYLTLRDDRDTPAVVLSIKTPGVMRGPLAAAGIPVHSLDLPEPRGLGVIALAVRLPFAVLKTARLIDELQPKAVKGWMYHAAVLGDLALRRAKCGASVRFIAGIRCSAMNGQLYGLVHRWTVERMKAIADRVDALAYNSETGRIEHEAIGFSPVHACVVPNGIDTASFAPNPGCRITVRRKLGIDEDRPVLIAAARVDPMKDYATLLRAFKMLGGRADLIVAGKDTDTVLPSMRGLHRLGPRKDMADLYGAADIVVMSSAFGEGFPNVVGEGMACGLVPVVTDVGDAAYIAGETGAVVQPGDPAALSAAIINLLDEGQVKLAERKIAARNRIERRFSLKTAIARLEALMEGRPFSEPDIVDIDDFDQIEDEPDDAGDAPANGEAPGSDSGSPDKTPENQL